MMAVAMASFGALFVAFWAAMVSPSQSVGSVVDQAQYQAAAFLNYRAAVIRYLEANPAAPEGSVSLTSLAPYATNGMSIPASGYGNYWQKTPGASNPGLYVYTTSAASSPMVIEGAKMMQNSLLVGYASSGGTKYLVSPLGGQLSIVLPSAPAIPAGAMVVIGK